MEFMYLGQNYKTQESAQELWKTDAYIRLPNGVYLDMVWGWEEPYFMADIWQVDAEDVVDGVRVAQAELVGDK